MRPSNIMKLEFRFKKPEACNWKLRWIWLLLSGCICFSIWTILCSWKDMIKFSRGASIATTAILASSSSFEEPNKPNLLTDDFDIPPEEEQEQDLCKWHPPIQKEPENLTVSAVIITRNDGYGGNLTERANISIRYMLSVYDEVVVVDMNSPKGMPPKITDLAEDIQSSPKLKNVVVSGDECKEKYLPQGCGHRMHEDLARKIGVDSATSDIIISTNIDVIPVSRSQLDRIIRTTMPTWKHAVIFKRESINLMDANDYIAALSKTEISPTNHINNNTKDLSDSCTSITQFKWGQVDFLKTCIMANCGDVQMAHRELWRRATFQHWKYMKGKVWGDCILHISWMNAGAVVQVASDAFTVRHIDHNRISNVPINPLPKVKLIPKVNNNGTTEIKFFASGWEKDLVLL